MGHHDFYNHKRTGRLVHCYGALVGKSTIGMYVVKEVYSYHAHGDTSLNVSHNCTIIGSTNYRYLSHANHAAKHKQLGTFKTVFVDHNDHKVCIDSQSRRTDFIVGLVMLLSIPVLFFIIPCCYGCFVSYTGTGNRNNYSTTAAANQQPNESGSPPSVADSDLSDSDVDIVCAVTKGLYFAVKMIGEHMDVIIYIIGQIAADDDDL